MSAASRIKYAYYAYLAKPKSERKLYREIRRRRPQRIVELGLSSKQRSLRMLRVVARYAPGPVEYTGIDLFEARGKDYEGLTLKQAHKLFKPMASKVRLLPGDPFSALAAASNTLVGTDLLIISVDQNLESLTKAWFYVPRMLTSTSLVLHEQPIESEEQKENKPLQTQLVNVSRMEIEAWAAIQTKARRRAA